MKTAVSLPDQVFKAAERLSRRKHMSRSELYATALRRYIAEEEGTGITEQINRVLEKNQMYDPVVEATSIADLPPNDWQ
jgi:metal-responsive CopG/Arc/MetJ family transcriptional regulator